MSANGNTDGRELCRAASTEMDPNRLMELIAQINEALMPEGEEASSIRPTNATTERLA